MATRAPSPAVTATCTLVPAHVPAAQIPETLVIPFGSTTSTSLNVRLGARLCCHTSELAQRGVHTEAEQKLLRMNRRAVFSDEGEGRVVLHDAGDLLLHQHGPRLLRVRVPELDEHRPGDTRRSRGGTS